eukprot:jgi/Galph1/2730/GphlegSOOS_G1418.1
MTSTFDVPLNTTTFSHNNSRNHNGTIVHYDGTKQVPFHSTEGTDNVVSQEISDEDTENVLKRLSVLSLPNQENLSKSKKQDKLYYASRETELPPPGVSPVSWYNTKIRQAVGQRNIKTILSTLTDMRVTQGVHPNAVTFAASLSCCSKLRDFESAKIIWKMYEEEKLPFSNYVFSSMIAVCCRSYPPRVDMALKLFNMLVTAGIQPNKIVYNATIDICSRTNRIKEALQLFEDFQMAGEQPDAYTYNAILRAYASTGDLEATRRVYQQMLNASNKKSNNLAGPNVITFSIILEALGKSQKLEEAFQFFDEMKRRGIEPNLVTYNVLIGACGHSGDYQKAVEVFREMENKSLQGDRYTYNGMIQSAVLTKRYKEAFVWYELLLSAGIVPNTVTFRLMFEACGGLQSFPMVELCLMHMERMGIVLNVYTYAALIAACVCCNELAVGQVYQRQATSVLKKQRKIFYEQLAMILQNLGDDERAQKIFSKLAEQQHVPLQEYS